MQSLTVLVGKFSSSSVDVVRANEVDTVPQGLAAAAELYCALQVLATVPAALAAANELYHDRITTLDRRLASGRDGAAAMLRMCDERETLVGVLTAIVTPVSKSIATLRTDAQTNPNLKCIHGALAAAAGKLGGWVDVIASLDDSRDCDAALAA